MRCPQADYIGVDGCEFRAASYEQALDSNSRLEAQSSEPAFSGAASVDQQWIDGSQRGSQRCRRARRRGRLRKANISSQKNGQQRSDCGRVQTFAGKIFNDANGFVGIMRLLVRTVG